MADNLLLPVCLDRVLDSNGDPSGGANVYVYDAGTTDLKNVFTDIALTIAAANPMIADSGGYLAARYIGTGSYKLFSTTSADVTIKTEDNLPGALDTSGFSVDEATPITPVISKTTAYTVVVGDKGKIIDADPTGGAFTITLLSAITAGDDFRLTIKHTGTANAVTVDGDGSETIDGALTYVLNFQHESITITSDGANWHITEDARQVANAQGVSLINGILSASVGSSALTVAIKTLAGDDPSNSDPVYVLVRSGTGTSGAYVRRRINAATSVTASSGSTLGTSNSVPFKLWVTLHDNDGTLYLGVSNRRTSTGIAALNEYMMPSTTAEGGAGGADDAETIYTSSATTTEAMAILGFLEWSSGLSTAGTWNTGPTLAHLKSPSTPLPGTVIQVRQVTRTNETSIASATFADLSGMSITINVTSAANAILADLRATIGNAVASRGASFKILRGSTDILVGDAASARTQMLCEQTSSSTSLMNTCSASVLDAPGAAGSLTYKIQWRSPFAGSTAYLNQSGADTDTSDFGRAASTFTLHEIMG